MFSGVSSTCSVLPRDVGACCLELTQACTFQILHMGSEKKQTLRATQGEGHLNNATLHLFSVGRGHLFSGISSTCSALPCLDVWPWGLQLRVDAGLQAYIHSNPAYGNLKGKKTEQQRGEGALDTLNSGTLHGFIAGRVHLFSGISSTCSVLPRLDVWACSLELMQACRPTSIQTLPMRI